jgi:hypothetical protein
MDGSCFVPDVGVPQRITVLTIGDTAAAADFVLPIIVPLIGPGKFKYAYCKGSRMYLGNDTMSQLIAARPDQKAFLQVLSDNAALYGIRFDGKIEAFDHEGKSLWKYELKDNLSGPSILVENQLIIPSDSSISAIDIHTGKELWFYPSQSPFKTPIYDSKSKLIVSATSYNNSNASDSILCLSVSGTLKSRCGFPRTRIISNISLCGKAKDRIAFGYITKSPEADAVRVLKVAIYSGVESGAPVKICDHEVPYLPMNIASNGPVVLVSGFERMGGNMESGVDAFSADDTAKLWQRRFTEPLAAQVAISNKYAYFSLSFTTQAEVPAKSIFYTLDVYTGKTLGELPIKGVRNGSASGMPTPLGESEFMLYDESHPVVYFLKP